MDNVTPLAQAAARLKSRLQQILGCTPSDPVLVRESWGVFAVYHLQQGRVHFREDGGRLVLSSQHGIGREAWEKLYGLEEVI
jgi:hypothetical protein